jgi:hypothetical protein
MLKSALFNTTTRNNTHFLHKFRLAHSTIGAIFESMFSFLLQTLFAIQGTTQRTGSSSSHLFGLFLPSSTFIISKAQQRDALVAAPPSLNDDIIDQSDDALDWLQIRLGSNDEHLIELAKRFPEVHTLSIEEQLQTMLDWLQIQVRLG